MSGAVVGLRAGPKKAIAVAVDVNPAVTVLTERYAEYDEVGIRVVLRLDHKPVAPNSIIVLTTTA